MTEKILILDFGSQYTQLIARAVREANVYCEITPYHKPIVVDEYLKGIILSGSPFSVNDAKAPTVDIEALTKQFPVLGICYGAQLTAKQLGGRVEKSEKREYGRAVLRKEKEDVLLKDISETSQVWMSHSDTIKHLPTNGILIGSTNDVANAVMEGADAVLLSGETATGQHPVLVIETMSKIIGEIENKAYNYNREDDLTPQPHSPSFLSDAICYNACKLAKDASAEALVGMTQSGYTAFMLSSYRPSSPLYIFTKEKSLVNQLSLSWGVRAFYYAEEDSLDDIIFDQINILKERGFLKPGDVVVNTGSTPVDQHLPTNIIKLTKVI